MTKNNCNSQGFLPLFVVRLACMAILFASSGSIWAQRGGGKMAADRVPKYFADYDLNGDGRIVRSEWVGRGNFDLIDTDKDDSIDLSEFRVIYAKGAGKVTLAKPILAAEIPDMDPSALTDRISPESVGKEVICAITRSNRCPNGNMLGEERGLFETGLGPTFPQGARCQGVDETFAMRYFDKTGKGMHGGIDIPADFGAPILAAAAGTVVGVFSGEENARGKTIVLRHNPQDTGLPMWTYTEYAHFDVLPTYVIGQRVRMGEVLGPTGNSGSTPGSPGAHMNLRRPGIHFAVYYSDSPRYAANINYVIPENARWMDSHALYRKTPPYDSASIKVLPEAAKPTSIPVMYASGETEPLDTKVIWPNACNRL